MQVTTGYVPITNAPEPAAKPAETREHERKDLQVEVGLLADCQFYTGFAQNISSGGLFIATHDSMPVGTQFEVSFSVPDVNHVFNAKCEVRWVRSYDGGALNDLSPGMGVRFMNLGTLEAELINQFISGSDTIFFEDE
jgi:uncharacterized protein (TIGR02266 family)